MKKHKVLLLVTVIILLAVGFMAYAQGYKSRKTAESTAELAKWIENVEDRLSKIENRLDLLEISSNDSNGKQPVLPIRPTPPSYNPPPIYDPPPRIKIKCFSCDGTGLDNCFSCKGSGNSSFKCFGCNGTGSSSGFRCFSCGGRGYNKCFSCNGKGLTTCSMCNGKGEH